MSAMHIALTRAVPPTIADCELTHCPRSPIDLDRAIAQHVEYEAMLGALGARVERVEAAPDLPDSVFIEDTAVVVDEVAVLMRPGASSRRPEVDAVAAALGRYRPLQSIVAPGTMDGGDVLRAGRRVFVGLSLRTNHDALRQLQAILVPLGYAVDDIPVERCLHLKSAATAAADDLLVLNPAWIDPARFGGIEWVAIDPGEPSGANVVRVRDTVVCPTSAPRTRERLEARGLTVRAVDASELAKAEGALTCASLIFSLSAVTR
jgi:dimethylargininase